MDNNQLPEDWATYFGLPDQTFDLAMFEGVPEAHNALEYIPQQSQFSDDPFQPILSDIASIPALELEPGAGEMGQSQHREQTPDQQDTDRTSRDLSSRLDEIDKKLARLDEKVGYMISVGEKCLEAQESESTKVQNSIRDVKSVIGNLVNSMVNDLLVDEVGEGQER